MSEPGTGRGRGGGLTYADYAALPDDGCRYQLVEGELVVCPSPTSWHQRIKGEIYHLLRHHVDAGGLGVVLDAPLDVVLDDHNVLQPDVLFISTAHRAIYRKQNITGPPDLCVEVLSPGTERLDKLRKLELYARFGVPHYWIVDPEGRTTEEYVLQGDLYGVRSVTPFSNEFRPVAFPGFGLTLETVELPD